MVRRGGSEGEGGKPSTLGPAAQGPRACCSATPLGVGLRSPATCSTAALRRAISSAVRTSTSSSRRLLHATQPSGAVGRAGTLRLHHLVRLPGAPCLLATVMHSGGWECCSMFVHPDRTWDCSWLRHGDPVRPLGAPVHEQSGQLSAMQPGDPCIHAAAAGAGLGCMRAPLHLGTSQPCFRKPIDKGWHHPMRVRPAGKCGTKA